MAGVIYRALQVLRFVVPGVLLFTTATDCWAPPVIGAVVAAAAAGVSAAITGAVIGTAMISAFVSTLVLGLVAQALAPKPKTPGQADRTVTIRSPIAPREFIYGQVRTAGVLTFIKVEEVSVQVIASVNFTERTLNFILTFAGHEVEEIGNIYFNSRLVPLDSNGNATGHYAGKARVHKRLGTADDTAFAELVALAPSTANLRQRGCAHVFVQLVKDNERYPNGAPNVTALIKGKKCYDPRTGLTAWTDNPALCIADYLCTPVADGGCGADYATEINETELIAAANVCDESVSLAAGGTEKRYTLNGKISTAAEPKANIEAMCAAMAGSCVYIGGKWVIRAGAHVTPAVSFSESDARGPIRTQTRLSRAEIFNCVRAVYTSPQNQWQPADAPPLKSNTYIAEDGEELPRSFDFPMTTSASMVQRLMKIELLRARQQITVEFPANLKGLLVKPGDTVYLNSTAKGWSSKVFLVVGWKLSIYEDANGHPALGVDLLLRETAASVWDWTTDEESTVDDAPDTELENPFTPTPPGISSVTEQLYATTGSAGVKSRAVVTLGIADDGTAWDYVVEVSPAGLNEWTAMPVTKNPVTVIDDLAPGVYDFRARSFGGIGVASVYSATFTKELLGLTAPPADITGFTVRAQGGRAEITLDRHPDLDVIQGGRIIVRHSPNPGADWNEGSLLTPPDANGDPGGWPGDSVMFTAPLLAGTYMAKARDSSGNMSANAVSFEVTDADITGYATVDSLVEDPAFAGVKSSIAIVDGGLQLAGVSDVDDIPMVDDVVDWDAEGGVATTGMYTFDNALNLGSAQTVRLFPHVRSIAFDTAGLWDERTGDIDEWDEIDGGLVDDVEATLFVRVTTDDPSGAPVWGPWHPLPGPADYTCWGAQFKLYWQSADPTHNRNVDQLRVTVKQAA